MATRIRLRKVGRKKQASFRIVVAGSIHARSGRVTETIGKYNPRTEPAYLEIDETRALYWLRQGAMVSEGVEPLFRKVGIMKKFADGAEGEGVKVIGDAHGKTVHPPKPGKAKKKAAEADEAEEKPAEAAAPEAAAEAEPEAATEAEPEAAAEAEPEAATEAEPEAATEAEPEAAAEAPEPEAEEDKQEAES
jgi:small subunit ribosomal protein S16